MAPYIETNPHFIRPLQPDLEDQHSHPPTTPRVSLPPHRQGQHTSSPAPRFTPPPPRHGERVTPPPPRHGKRGRKHPPTPIAVPPGPPQHLQIHEHSPPPHQGPKPFSNDSRTAQPQLQGHQPLPGVQVPHHQDNPHQAHGDETPGHRRIFVPAPQKTQPLAWLTAVFCAIFWIIIFLGGLAVLIVYLVFRPRSPKFDVSSATLNFAYLDMGNLLNADMTLLTNFTNPNHKVRIDFSYIVIDLNYGGKLIATQYIEPFSAAKAESRFTYVHMVTSQVGLSLKESQWLQKQISSNGVVFDVKALIRARSDLGSFLKYSYWLYGHCTIMVTGPPNGVLTAHRCKTKR
ncbi:hypothetical protein HS088_TW10G00108 [Tripterygium wilfordii]|uniref:Late embryogenesis abundant protein LEA-2 subgroup domain-containing protein n=1 Tax=Tripterygium wilfordii TaxID=458696 RepID=A0A7J7D467_TRIWF|nr:uncharacterized protein At1g08160-like [Tripterygium wilfordii]KAF5741113.1 hypothetical protein HS088_TW10G00108 [Tripterygium wilfordii]